MSEPLRLHDPWLVAVWPGMGHVALSAGVYLVSKLGMKTVSELETGELFDVEQVEVRAGIIQPVRRARNRFFVWIDPSGQHDLVVFLGEAQLPIGRYPFCSQVMAYAKELGVQRVFTFAAMATRMQPDQPARVFAAVTGEAELLEVQGLDLELLEEGDIGGLNGVLLAAAAELELPGICFLGEMPHSFVRLPFPKASLAILQVFKQLAGIDLDLDELSEQSLAMADQLEELPDQAPEPDDAELADDIKNDFAADFSNTPGRESGTKALNAAENEHLEDLFHSAAQDGSKALELKKELDRLGRFKEYEDRFLDLFLKRG